MVEVNALISVLGDPPTTVVDQMCGWMDANGWKYTARPPQTITFHFSMECADSEVNVEAIADRIAVVLRRSFWPKVNVLIVSSNAYAAT